MRGVTLIPCFKHRKRYRVCFSVPKLCSDQPMTGWLAARTLKIGSRELIWRLPLEKAWPIKRETMPASAGAKGVRGAVWGLYHPRPSQTFHVLSFLLSILPTHSLFLNLPAVLLGIFLHLRFFSFFPSTTQLDVGAGLEGFWSLGFLRQTAFRRRAHLSFLKSVKDRKFSPNVDAGRFTLYPHNLHRLVECVVFP